jgi:hypothetical protein
VIPFPEPCPRTFAIQPALKSAFLTADKINPRDDLLFAQDQAHVDLFTTTVATLGILGSAFAADMTGAEIKALLSGKTVQYLHGCCAERCTGHYGQCDLIICIHAKFPPWRCKLSDRSLNCGRFLRLTNAHDGRPIKRPVLQKRACRQHNGSLERKTRHIPVSRAALVLVYSNAWR